MSCWLVPADHIDLLVTGARWLGQLTSSWLIWPGDAGQRLELTPFADFDAVGRELIAENMRSVTCRYGDRDPETMPGPNDKSRLLAYRFRPVLAALDGGVTRIDALGVLAEAIACYRYQSCECPDWEQSRANQLMIAMEGAILHALAELTGAAAWPWTRPGRDT